MITAPGAPPTGLAAALRIPPRPSPSHHTATDQTTEAARAAFSAGRHAIPSASSNWMVANAVFVETGWCSMMPDDQVIGRAMKPGLPAALSASICPNALVNIQDWYCKTASSSQIPARASCSARRVPGTRQVTQAAAAPWPLRAGERPANAVSLIQVSPKGGCQRGALDPGSAMPAADPPIRLRRTRHRNISLGAKGQQ